LTSRLRTFGIGQDDLERGRRLGVRVAADLHEVGRAAAVVRDHVHGGHGQTGPVGQDAHVAVEFHVEQSQRAGAPFQFGALLAERGFDARE
jgi:hypothetical protein